MGINKRLCRFAAFSCVHAPFQNEEAISNLLDALPGPYGTPTDIICLGDLFESTAASVHPDEHNHTLADEYAAAAGFLKSVRLKCGKSTRLHWCLGNHDDNLQTPDSRRTDWRTRELIHWMQTDWAHEFRRWKQYPYVKPSIHDQRGCLQLGQVIFAHGWDAGANSDELEGLQLANACGGHAHRLIIRGHTHRPRQVSQCRRSSRVPLPWWFANAGTLGPLQPHYMRRKDVSGWGPAVVFGECKIDTPSRFSGKCWDAHVKML